MLHCCGVDMKPLGSKKEPFGQSIFAQSEAFLKKLRI